MVETATTIEFTTQEIREQLDREARARRGMSGAELLRAYEEGRLEDPGEVVDLLRPMDPNPIRRVARSGVLVLGGGFAGRHAARTLGRRGITVVEPRPTQGSLDPRAELIVGTAVALDAERRVVQVEARPDRIAIAYAQLIVALGAFADSVARLGLPSDLRGRVRVDENLRVIGAQNIWAIGKCISLPTGAPRENASGLRIPD